MKRIVVGVTGASGIIYAVRLLEALREAEDVKVYTVFSRYAWLNLENETAYTQEYIRSLSDAMFDNGDLAASISSGSFRIDGTVILPCSMKTLSAAANGYADNLISRVIDVAVKEKRKLVLSPRETPLSPIHLRNMLTMAECGALILPPMPAFYTNPESVDDIVSHHTMKILDYFDIGYPGEKRWQGRKDKT